MIVFPFYLEHWVRPNSNNITVAGNIKIVNLMTNKSERKHIRNK